MEQDSLEQRFHSFREQAQNLGFREKESEKYILLIVQALNNENLTIDDKTALFDSLAEVYFDAGKKAQKKFTPKSKRKEVK